MSGRIVKIEPVKVEPETIELIAQALRQGAVIVYPTDTFYGLGADCFSHSALSRIYQVKARPPTKALPVLISGAEMVKDLAAEIPAIFYRIAEAFWPGPLTFVLKAAAGLPASLVGPERTIGIRLPAVAWLRELVRQASSPIVATSANISGEGEIALAEEAIRMFLNKVDMIVDGGRTPGGLPSTVVDLSFEIPVIRREGAIPRAELQKLGIHISR